MKQYSEDKFEFKSRLTSKEILDRLQEHTLKKKWLSMTWTDKDFIGQIDQNSFAVITSSFPFAYGVACVVSGNVGLTSGINLRTSLHRAFRILFSAWLFIMTGGLIFSWFRESGGLVGAFVIICGMAVAGFILRICLHAMYVWARNDALNKLRLILELE